MTRPGGHLHLLCFRDAGPESGPHPVAEDELRAAFGTEAGWHVAALGQDRIHTRFAADGVPARLADIERLRPVTGRNPSQARHELVDLVNPPRLPW